MPTGAYFSQHPALRPRLSAKEFAKRHGAHPRDMSRVKSFLKRRGLIVTRLDPASRSITARGTAAHLSRAFAIPLGWYHLPADARPLNRRPAAGFLAREGPLHVPQALTELILGVFGLDNRPGSIACAAVPNSTAPLTVATVAQTYYQFPYSNPPNPPVSLARQNIGIVALASYDQTGINNTVTPNPPVPTDITVMPVAPNSKIVAWETTQDICIAAQAAPGAGIIVYFTDDTDAGWISLIQRVAHPLAGDPVCHVLSCSFIAAGGDDTKGLGERSRGPDFLQCMTRHLHDAAVQNITVCVATGDYGTNSGLGAAPNGDGFAHVAYPASDPWVLAVGGTTIGNPSGGQCYEYVWNDPDANNLGTTGGGISAHFPPPDYQGSVTFPAPLNPGGTPGRGIPDVAANANPQSGYPMNYNLAPFTASGTSAAAPLWAGLIAVINANLPDNVGFINQVIYDPVFYQTAAKLSPPTYPFRYIYGQPPLSDAPASGPNNGPDNNGNGGVRGYPTPAPGPGINWNACTGLGSPNGSDLLATLRQYYQDHGGVPAAPALPGRPQVLPPPWLDREKAFWGASSQPSTWGD